VGWGGIWEYLDYLSMDMEMESGGGLLLETA
jgi:hypothetical protein